MEKKIKERREKRKSRVRKKIFGVSDKPRLSVYRSLNNLYVQLIDDVSGKTILSASTLEKQFKSHNKYGGNKKAAVFLGKLIADKSKEKGIKKVKFDRGRFSYHGRIKSLADAARENGLDF